MKLENLRDVFPDIPENISKMIENEVAVQMKNQDHNTGTDGGNIHARPVMRSRRSLKRIAVIAAAAVLVLSTGVFAGAKIYKWHISKDDTYSIKATLISEDTNSRSLDVPDKVPELEISFTELPENFAQDRSDPLKYHSLRSNGQGGFSISTIVMDETISAKDLPVSDAYVTHHEIYDADGRDVLYLEKQTGSDDSIHFDKKFYIPYPEYSLIAAVYAGEDVSEADAKKAVGSMTVNPSGKERKVKASMLWSNMTDSDSNESLRLTATFEEMKNLHSIGDTFTLPSHAYSSGGKWIRTSDVTAKVTDVSIMDSERTLSNTLVSDELRSASTQDGGLKENVISYVQSGNGKDSLDKVIKKEKQDQLIAYATIRLTNTGSDELSDILLAASVSCIVKNGGKYMIYDRALMDDDERTDVTTCSGPGGPGEMDYYDTGSRSADKNYISSLSPGQSIDVHVAKVVNADETGRLYLSLCDESDAFNFTSAALKAGYVDIRQ